MSRELWILQVILSVGVVVGATYSHHGLMDMRKFSGQISIAKSRVSLIENENRKLKREVDLLHQPGIEIAESQVRNYLGWARSDEIVYLDRSLK